MTARCAPVIILRHHSAKKSGKISPRKPREIPTVLPRAAEFSSQKRSTPPVLQREQLLFDK
jgi:hypothetical protein